MCMPERCSDGEHPWREPVYRPGDFRRQDENDDSEFYARDRMVSHLDRTALGTVERLIGSLVVEDEPHILDLMASWDSHLPECLKPARVSGLGLNQNELRQNPALNEYALHDLNAEPRLPYADASFDAVLNTVSVDYLIDPVAVFKEAGRVLKPSGLLLVIFSNRYFPPKVTRIWQESNEIERVCLVEEWFKAAGLFGPVRSFVSKGLPRPADDKYADSEPTSDPIYAVFAERAGGEACRAPRPLPGCLVSEAEKATYERRLKDIDSNLECPHCGERLKKWAIPQTPFTEWEHEFMYVCMNDFCPLPASGLSGHG